MKTGVAIKLVTPLKSALYWNRPAAGWADTLTEDCIFEGSSVIPLHVVLTRIRDKQTLEDLKLVRIKLVETIEESPL